MPDDSEITETIIGAAYTVLNKLNFKHAKLGIKRVSL